MSYSLEQIRIALQRGLVRATAETCGYLALAVAEQAVDCDTWQAGRIQLEPSASVTVLSSANGEAPAGLIGRWLDAVLGAASGEKRGLERLLARGPATVVALKEGLEQALLPLNRGAARRALVRLHRGLDGVTGETWAAAHTAELDAGRRDDRGLSDARGRSASVERAAVPPPAARQIPPALSAERSMGPVPARPCHPPPPSPTSLEATPFLGSGGSAVTAYAEGRHFHRESEQTEHDSLVAEVTPMPPSPHLSDFRPQRSDVSALLSEFAEHLSSTEGDAILSSLRELAELPRQSV